MLLKCLLLKLLQRGDNRGQAIFELDNKETNRKTPRCFLTKTRGDSQCGHTRTCSEYPWTFGARPWMTEERKRPWVSREEKKSPWVTESKMSLRGACLHATWQSQQNKIICRDPHVSPLDFLRMTIRVLGREPRVGFSILLRMTILKIGRSLDDCLRNLGVTVNNKYRNRGIVHVNNFADAFCVVVSFIV